MATSSSQDSTNGWYQPGGTLAIALGKWASCIINWDMDKVLSCWLYLEFVGQHGMWLVMVSSYHICPQTFDATTNTVTVQWTHLLQQGVTNPNLRKHSITQIKQWCNQGKEVLVGMDANENIYNPHSKITRLFMETDLVDLHHHCFPATTKLATHQQGSDLST